MIKALDDKDLPDSVIVTKVQEAIAGYNGRTGHQQRQSQISKAGINLAGTQELLHNTPPVTPHHEHLKSPTQNEHTPHIREKETVAKCTTRVMLYFITFVRCPWSIKIGTSIRSSQETSDR